MINPATKKSNEMNYKKWVDLAPFKKYGSDLVLNISCVLTEPTCPLATVTFEYLNPEYDLNIAVFGNTIEDAVSKALELTEEKLKEFYDE